MKLYLCSASLPEIGWAVSNHLVDGVITSPALLSDEAAPDDMLDRLREICRAVQGPVIASVTSVNADEMYRDGRDLARLGDQIVVELPLIEDSLGAIRRLAAEGIRVSVSLVYNAAQALLGAKAGASAVSVPFRDLDAHGQSGAGAIAEIRQLFNAASVECDIIALSAGNPGELAQAVLSGAHAVAVSPAVLRRSLLHPLTDRGIDQLLKVLSSLPKGRAS